MQCACSHTKKKADSVTLWPEYHGSEPHSDFSGAPRSCLTLNDKISRRRHCGWLCAMPSLNQTQELEDLLASHQLSEKISSSQCSLVAGIKRWNFVFLQTRYIHNCTCHISVMTCLQNVSDHVRITFMIWLSSKLSGDGGGGDGDVVRPSSHQRFRMRIVETCNYLQRASMQRSENLPVYTNATRRDSVLSWLHLCIILFTFSAFFVVP